MTLRVVTFTKLQLKLLGRTDELIQLLNPVLAAVANLTLRFGDPEFPNTKAGLPFKLSLLENATTLLITISNDGKQIAKHIVVELEFRKTQFTNFSTEFELRESVNKDSKLVQVFVPRVLHPAQKMKILLRFDVCDSYDGSMEHIKAGLFWTDFQPRFLPYPLMFTVGK